jgi:hypothetical protein
LLADEETERRAAGESATDVFRASLSVLEVKKAKHSLDKVSTKETAGWFPSQQIQDYLRWATDGTGRRFFRWAILSNGNEWRLYCYDAAPDAYFSFTLAHDTQFCPLEDFRLFASLLQPSAFTRDERGRCLLDEFRDESLTRQLELEINLRRRIFDVLEDLAEGLYRNPANRLSQADLPAVYEASLILLYRLLFVLYAESRGLLPAKPYGPRSNKRYREEFSLARLVDKLRDASSFPDDAFDGLYKDLLKLFHLVNGTKKEQNEKLRVTRYNGRLFSAEEHPNIERWWVGETSLANVLRQLTFAQPPARSRSHQGVITTDETVDYSTLEVRQLGDIYEGLLGGHLELSDDGHLALKNERGENQRHGIFYTPDWIVLYLVREALAPVLAEIDGRREVESAKAGRSEERRRNNCFAHAVLRLNLLDPAMGSGHFLVRATEFLAQRIFDHPTTRRMTEQVVASGQQRRSREEILADARVPVAPGISQEQAEISYWRRRVVEACIYGLDTSSLAVELAKLSLWLTCIAVDEPLNFLDHHLCCGNALLGAAPAELRRLPSTSETDGEDAVFEAGDRLTEALSAVIRQNADIETRASTEMEVVKAKEEQWKKVRAKLQPFLYVADVWLSTYDDVSIDHIDYRNLAIAATDPDALTPKQNAEAQKVRDSLAPRLAEVKETLQPFHWQLEFPDVFYETDGRLLPDESRGFDVLLGNPPYVSTHTSSEERWRNAVGRRAGFAEDLYVHFADLGFSLLRPGGMIGFIVSDTFFTLPSKLRMRVLLQKSRLTHLGQCIPFDATVDAAFFVARKHSMRDDEHLLFIQARSGNEASKPEKELENVKGPEAFAFPTEEDDLHVRHGSVGCLRLHRAPIGLYRNALRRSFFEPGRAVLELYRRFNEPVKELAACWWDLVESSKALSVNLPKIRAYQARLRPGDLTLVGLVAEGAQGMRTGDNGRFLAYLSGTPQAETVRTRRTQLTDAWLAHRDIRPAFLEVLAEIGGDPKRPTLNVAAWEACAERLRARPELRGQLGFGRTDLYRVVSEDSIATTEDFRSNWIGRKAELLERWQHESQLAEFWQESQQRLIASGDPLPLAAAAKLRTAADVPDDVFCRLCQELLAWWHRENERRRQSHPRRPPVPLEVLGLRPSESYADPAEAPRIAAIYNGLAGRRRWVPFRKGDPEGNRWLDNEPLFIDWSAESVGWLSKAPSARWQGHFLFFTPGVTWTAVANHVAMKARYQDACVFDADSMRLTPRPDVLDPLAFLSLLNSDVVSFFKMKFVKHTQKWEIGDLRLLPLVVPTRAQAARLSQLAGQALAAKRLSFSGAVLPDELVGYTRKLARYLLAGAPAYLRPPAQIQLVGTPSDCLGMIELAVNWEAEKLYRVEGLGPFDEF